MGICGPSLFTLVALGGLIFVAMLGCVIAGLPFYSDSSEHDEFLALPISRPMPARCLNRLFRGRATADSAPLGNTQAFKAMVPDPAIASTFLQERGLQTSTTPNFGQAATI